MFVPPRNRGAFDPREPFSRAEAQAAGLTAEMLLSKRFHKIFWDAYVSRDVPITPLLRARAVIRLVPAGSYISHHTAAELWGAAPPPSGGTHITLSSASGRQVRRGVRSHYRSQRGRTTLRKGLPISTPEQTFLDLAGIGVGLVALVVVADGMIKERHTSPERLIEAAAQWSGKGMPGGTQRRVTRARRRGFATGDPAPPASRPRWPSGATCQCGHSWAGWQLAPALRPGVRTSSADH